MPECSEVRLMSDFINFVSSKEIAFEKIEKSEVSKISTDLEIFDGGVFSIESNSRGKELMIIFSIIGGNTNMIKEKRLLINLGMSGTFAYLDKNSVNLVKILKHSHLRILTARGNYLVLHDVRRFAKWRWVDDWSNGRGPCPLSEYQKFSNNIYNNINSNAFNANLHELLMNQSYFNGVGNYLRSEILFRLNINPFIKANELSYDQWQELILLCHSCISDAYTLQGGKVTNYLSNTPEKSMATWMKCYGNKKMLTIIDKNKRKFWYNPIWEEESRLQINDI